MIAIEVIYCYGNSMVHINILEIGLQILKRPFLKYLLYKENAMTHGAQTFLTPVIHNKILHLQLIMCLILHEADAILSNMPC
jgi:hypothetical protein